MDPIMICNEDLSFLVCFNLGLDANNLLKCQQKLFKKNLKPFIGMYILLYSRVSCPILS